MIFIEVYTNRRERKKIYYEKTKDINAAGGMKPIFVDFCIDFCSTLFGHLFIILNTLRIKWWNGSNFAYSYNNAFHVHSILNQWDSYFIFNWRDYRCQLHPSATCRLSRKWLFNFCQINDFICKFIYIYFHVSSILWWKFITRKMWKDKKSKSETLALPVVTQKALLMFLLSIWCTPSHNHNHKRLYLFAFPIFVMRSK